MPGTNPNAYDPHPTETPPAHLTGPSDAPGPGSPQLGRRALLIGGAAGVGGALGAAATWAATSAQADPLDGLRSASAEAERAANVVGDAPGFGGEVLPCHGTHQAGITTQPAAHVRYLAFDLLPHTDHAALQRMFRILTEDIEGLTSGTAPLADPEPELAARPARCTITVGVGAGLARTAQLPTPANRFGPLPTYQRDQLDGAYSDGDLVLIIAADDPLPIAHATRQLQRDLSSFATLRWQQRGFRQARGAESDTTTMRNLMGQVDGTVNPAPDDTDFGELVWLGEDATWLHHGTVLVLRRIRLELDTWDRVDRPAREHSVGRRLSDGAPLTGGSEHTPVDFDARDTLGFSVIARDAHVRRAHSTQSAERIYRRSHNYEDDLESGLLFACYQRNPLAQFAPIQQRLDDADLLNLWVTHTGSAVFAMLPGFQPGELIGEALLAASKRHSATA